MTLSIQFQLAGSEVNSYLKPGQSHLFQEGGIFQFPLMWPLEWKRAWGTWSHPHWPEEQRMLTCGKREGRLHTLKHSWGRENRECYWGPRIPTLLSCPFLKSCCSLWNSPKHLQSVLQTWQLKLVQAGFCHLQLKNLNSDGTVSWDPAWTGMLDSFPITGWELSVCQAVC